MILNMQKSVWTEMHKYGETSPGHEVVGALLGLKTDDKNSECNEFISMTNVAGQNFEKKLIGTQNLKTEVHYVPDPNEFFQVLKQTTLMNKGAKKDFIGIFHTHPNHIAQPSVTDIYGAGYAGFYPIFSLLEKKTNVFFYDGINRSFEPSQINLIGD